MGNSMPIRDMDMYSAPRRVTQGSATLATRTLGSATLETDGVTPAAVPSHARPAGQCEGSAVPIAANRGASGIDGVLSTAAGFAFGLHRGATLVVGDVSFLHDINGLSLLRTGGTHVFYCKRYYMSHL
jgi:isochorismate synthase/2-succinyl-5-enolpyruvyl-6-hydroxy-3-cyclohexene-1-carboxylate synthase/2-succinyl-6-hydroxy-2,4-cyclohexadiene-1-carboxylate synthase/O-succinylbenzoate synthase